MNVSDLTDDECGPLTKIYTPQVPKGDFFEEMSKSTEVVMTLFKAIPLNKHLHRYAPDKWTIKEVLQHLIDVDRIFAFRALCFARGEKGSLLGFEVNDYATMSKANQRSMSDLLAEFEIVRASTVALFKSFDNKMLLRTGEASGTCNSVRALGFRLIGHDLHHCLIINEKYGIRSKDTGALDI